MKRLFVWVLALIEYGFANLGNSPKLYTREQYLISNACGLDERQGRVGQHVRVDSILFISSMKKCSFHSVHSYLNSRPKNCCLQLSASNGILNQTGIILRSSQPRTGLSLDYVADSRKLSAAESCAIQPQYFYTSHRPGSAVPKTWREGVDYDFGPSQGILVLGELVAVLLSDGSLRFGLIEMLPCESSSEYMVQVCKTTFWTSS